jgi:anti-sigma B factor antagonist
MHCGARLVLLGRSHVELAPSILLVAAPSAELEPVGVELAMAGLRSRAVDSAGEAVAQAQARAYEVAIISGELAEGGAALVQRLKQSRPGMACIVVTASPSREEALHSLSAGALAYLAGPLRVEALADLVKERRRHTLSATEAALSVRVAEEDGTPVLQLDGDLDIVTAPLLQRLIDELLGSGHDRLLLDADSLNFCDSTGLRILFLARRRLEERGGELRLLRSSSVLQRLLDLSGLDANLRPAVANNLSQAQ